MDTANKPLVLCVYYTYTQQNLKAVEAMAEALRDRGCEVALARIEFTDPRYADRFKQFPMPHPYFETIGMIPTALRRATGTIRIPDIVTAKEYDLVA